MEKYKRNKWYKYNYSELNKQILPPKDKEVLLFFSRSETSSQLFCVGYLRYAAGDHASPHFIFPGANRRDQPIAWNDCLPRDIIDWGGKMGIDS